LNQAPLIGQQFCFDGTRSWARLEFSEPVDLGNRSDHPEEEVRANHRVGSKVVWCPLQLANGQLQVHRKGSGIVSGQRFELLLPMPWAALLVHDGAYVTSALPYLPVVAECDCQMELRVWKVSAAELPGLRERAPRSAPPEHDREPDFTLLHNYSEANKNIDMGVVLESLPGLLYLELWRDSVWVSARYIDASGLGMSLRRAESAENVLVVWDLAAGTGVEGAVSQVLLMGRGGVYKVQEGDLELLELNKGRWAVVRVGEVESLVPCDPVARTQRPLDRIHLFTDRQTYQRNETVAFCGWYRSRSAAADPWESRPHGSLDYAVSQVDRGELEPQTHVAVRASIEPSRWGGFAGQFLIKPRSDREQISLEVVATDPEGDKLAANFLVQRRKLDYPENGGRLELTEQAVEFYAYYSSGEAMVGQTVEFHLRLGAARAGPSGFEGYEKTHQSDRNYPVDPNWKNKVKPVMVSETLTTDQNGRCVLPLPAVDLPGEGSLSVFATATARMPDGKSFQLVRVATRGQSDCITVAAKQWGDQMLVFACERDGRLLNRGSLQYWAGDEGEKKTVTLTDGLLRIECPGSEPERVYFRAEDSRGREAVCSLVRKVPQPGPLGSGPFPVHSQIFFDNESVREGELAKVRLFTDGGPALVVMTVVNGDNLFRECRESVKCESEWEFLVEQRFIGTCHVVFDIHTRHGHQTVQRELKVEPRRYRLEVSLECVPAAVAQDEISEIDIRVTRPDGTPAENADVVLLVVDKDASDLAGSGLDDPLNLFYHNDLPRYHLSSSTARTVHQPPTFSDDSSRLMISRCFEDGGLRSKPRGESPAFRQATEPLVYAGLHTTDEGGGVRVAVQMKGLPGEYKVVALAAHGWTDFGRGESRLVCRQPCMTLRMSHPDFLWVGDRLDLPVRLHNARATTLDAHLFVRAVGFAEKLHRETVQVRPQEASESVFTLKAAEEGMSLVQVAAKARTGDDRLQCEIPIYDQTLPSQWVEWGVLDAKGLVLPCSFEPEWRGSLQLDVWVDDVPRALLDEIQPRQDLTSAAQRLVAHLWFGEALLEFDKERGQPTYSLESCLSLLLKLQSPTGGFVMDASKATETDFLGCLFATRALWEAREHGHQLPADTLGKALSYLRASLDEKLGDLLNIGTPPGIQDQLLEDMGLFGQRTHPLEKAAISPLSNLGSEPYGPSPLGDWYAHEVRESTRRNRPLLLYWRLARQLKETPYREPHGRFRFGHQSHQLGELEVVGKETKAARYRLSKDLHLVKELRLEFEGEGHLFYSLTARATEPKGSRTAGYGLVRRTVNDQESDQRGRWFLKVGERARVTVHYDAPDGLAIWCKMARPAAFLCRSESVVLCSEQGHRGFRFDFEVRYPGEFVFPPAVVESFEGVLGRTDWQSILVE
jgi:hypothetical protein